MLSFAVDGKQAFEVSLADVSQSQLQGKNDVLLEFHVDDTAGANEVCITKKTGLLDLIIMSKLGNLKGTVFLSLTRKIA